MDTSNLLFIFTKTGLVLNLVGMIMLLLSFGKHHTDAYKLDAKGRKIYIASLRHPMCFKLGLVLIILGFILQLVI